MCFACGMRILPGMPMRPFSGWHLMHFSDAGTRLLLSPRGCMLR